MKSLILAGLFLTGFYGALFQSLNSEPEPQIQESQIQLVSMTSAKIGR